MHGDTHGNSGDGFADAGGPHPLPPFTAMTPAAPGGDILASEERPKRRRRLAPILAAIAAVLLVAGGIVGVKAYQTLSGGGPQPDKWAPSSTFAFAKVDFDPPAGAKVAAYRLSQKFPSLPRAEDAGDLKDSLFREMFADDEVIDYATDIKPWLGDRFAVAAFTDRNGDPRVVGILAHKNKASAEQSLQKAADEESMGYVVEDDFVLVADDEETAKLAAELARESSLADQPTYSDDIKRLRGNRVATAWVDLETGKDLLAESLGDEMFAAPEMFQLAGDMYSGRLVAGLHVDSSYLELEARQIGGTMQIKAGDAGQLLGGLPAGTVAMLVLSSPDEIVKQFFQVLQSSPEFDADVADSFDAFTGMTGLKMPDDLADLLGSAAVLSLGNISSMGDPQVSLRTRPADIDQAQDIAEMLADLLSGASAGEAEVDVQRNGSDLIMSLGAERDSKERLLDDATFRRAVGDLPNSLIAAGFVDLRKVWKLEPDAPRDLKAITGFGFMTGMDGNDVISRIRMVADR